MYDPDEITFYPPYQKKMDKYPGKLKIDIDNRRFDGKVLLIILAIMVACGITAIMSFRAGWDSASAYLDTNCQKIGGTIYAHKLD